jgi:hypothetical protein
VRQSSGWIGATGAVLDHAGLFRAAHSSASVGFGVSHSADPHSVGRWRTTAPNNRVPFPLATLAPMKHGPMAFWGACAVLMSLGRWVRPDVRVVGPRRHPGTLEDTGGSR